MVSGIIYNILLFSIYASLLILFLYISSDKLYSSPPAIGDYRVASTSGNWNSLSSWESYTVSGWTAASSTPTNANGVITIQNGQTLTVTANVNADQVIVESGGTLIINAGKKLTILNGTGTDIDIAGTVTMLGDIDNDNNSTMILTGLAVLANGGHHTFGGGATLTINNGGRYRREDASFPTATGFVIVNSGGIYQHNMNAQNLPQATWNTGSLCEITGMVGGKPGNLDQTFYSLTWNCPSQTGTLDLQGKITAVNGDLTFISTGSGLVRLGQDDAYHLVVGGNYIQQGGNVFADTKSLLCTIVIQGNFSLSGGSFAGTDASPDHGEGSPTITIQGNLNISAGTFDFSQYDDNKANKGITTLYLYGNYTQTGGIITETATQTGRGEFIFAKTGTQYFSRTAGTMTNTINYTVNSGSIVDMGTSVFTSSGTFTLSSGGGLNMGSADGITQSSALGNVQVTGTRSYNTNGDYTYNGLVTQVTGDGLPATIHNLTINNSTYATLTNTVSINNILYLTSGQLITGSNEAIVINAATTSITGHSATNYVRGNLRRYVNSTGSYDFPLGTAAYYEFANLDLTSSAGFTNILGTFVNSNPVNPSYPLSSLTILGTPVDSMLNYGYWTLSPNAAMSSGTYSVTLKEKGYTNTAYNPACYAVLKRNNATSSWQSVGTHSNSTQSENSGIVTAVRSGLSSFSHFGIGKHSGIGGLPIELISFDARYSDAVVELTWSTASEINNNYFTIERSSDGRNFEVLKNILGAGNSTTINNYSESDLNPLQGWSYYRLKQTDFDDSFTYSEIVSVNSKSEDVESIEGIITVMPNPFETSFVISYSVKASSEVLFQLINSSGQMIKEEKLIAAAGNNRHTFNVRELLSPGVYIVLMKSKNSESVIKLYKR